MCTVVPFEQELVDPVFVAGVSGRVKRKSDSGRPPDFDVEPRAVASGDCWPRALRQVIVVAVAGHPGIDSIVIDWTEGERLMWGKGLGVAGAHSCPCGRDDERPTLDP